MLSVFLRVRLEPIEDSDCFRIQGNDVMNAFQDAIVRIPEGGQEESIS